MQIFLLASRRTPVQKVDGPVTMQCLEDEVALGGIETDSLGQANSLICRPGPRICSQRHQCVLPTNIVLLKLTNGSRVSREQRKYHDDGSAPKQTKDDCRLLFMRKTLLTADRPQFDLRQTNIPDAARSYDH